MNNFYGFENLFLPAVVIARINEDYTSAELYTTRYWSAVSDLPVKLVFSLPETKNRLCIGDTITMSAVDSLFYYTKYSRHRTLGIVSNNRDWKNFFISKYDKVLGLVDSSLVIAGVISKQEPCGNRILYGIDLLKGWYTKPTPRKKLLVKN